MKTLNALVAAAAVLAAPALADLTFWEAHSIPAEELQDLVSQTSTLGMDGVAFGAGDNLFAIHANASSDETIFFFDPETDPPVGTVLRTASQIRTDLGFTGTPIFESGFDASPDGRYIYFVASDSADIDGELVLARIDSTVAPYAAVEILGGADLDDMTDFAVIPSGGSHQIVGVRGSTGVGTIDPFASTPAWVQRVTEAQLQAVLSTSSTIPTESVAVHPVNGTVYVFAHDVKELFSISNILTAPAATRVVVAGWPGVVDFHDLAVTASGKIVGFDEADPGSIRIFDGTTAYNYTLEDLAATIEGHSHTKSAKHGSGTGAEFEPALWRGLVAEDGPDNTVIGFFAAQGEELGVVEITFGTPAPMSAPDWQLYQ